MSQKIIVIGGVAGGATAAARIRRLDEQAQITVFERGEFVSFANCGLPYHLSKAIPNRKSLILKSPKEFKLNYNIDVKIKHEVLAILPQQKMVKVKEVESGREFIESYDKLVLSPGAATFTPPFVNEANLPVHTLKTIPDMDKVIADLESKNIERALVLGGGFIGVEIAENLTEKGIETHLVELGPQVMMPFDFEMANRLHKELVDNGVHLHLETSLEKVMSDGEAVLKNGKKFKIDLLISAVGVRPETKLAKEAGLALNERGAIVTDEFMRTSDPHIFAVGDAIQVKNVIDESMMMLPLAGPANRQARVAADNICGGETRYHGVQGTSIIKVFNLAAASTGINERYALKNNISYDTLYLHPFNHVTYYPGATQMSMKIIYDPNTYHLLGAQAVGAAGVDKRMDVLATAIRARMRLQDLQDIEFSYAPPFGAAKDAINMIGFMADNVASGRERFVSPQKLKNEWQLVDVRTPEEFKQGHIAGAKNIPLYELRARLNELDANRETAVYCAVGVRSHNAFSLLRQSGFKQLWNISGGYNNYKNFFERYADHEPAKRQQKTPCLSVVENDQKKKHEMNLIGLSCPGPIVALKEKLDEVADGEEVHALVSDRGFTRDVAAFCEVTGHTLIDVEPEGAHFRARLIKGKGKEKGAGSRHEKNVSASNNNKSKKTIVVFSNDLDKAMASFIIANGARAMGSDVTLFFTFWGLSLLKRERILTDAEKPIKTLKEKMFSWMMPKGSKGVHLSKMKMGGLGTLMMKHTMKSKNVLSLRDLIDSAMKSGVKMVACSMTMDVMGIKESELIAGVEIGGVAHYLSETEQAGTNLFI